ncbi:MAG: hypothetical protein ABIG84_03745 [archaeon]
MDSESKILYNPVGLLKESKLLGLKKTISFATLDDFINTVKKGKTNQVNISFKKYQILEKLLETMPCYSSQVILDSDSIEFGLYNHSDMALGILSSKSKRIRGFTYDNRSDEVILKDYNKIVKCRIYKDALISGTLTPNNELIECEIYKETLQEGIDIAEILGQSGLVLGKMEGIPLNTKTINQKKGAATKSPYDVDAIRNNITDLNNQIRELDGIIKTIEPIGYALSPRLQYFAPLHQKSS